MNIEVKKRDLEGEPVNVVTEYKVHTVSLVGVDTGESALGMNITKVKSANKGPETEEMKVLKEKVEKAKAKDKAEKEVLEPAEVQTNDQIIEKAKAEEIKEDIDSTENTVEDGFVEKSKSEEVEIAVEGVVNNPSDAVEKSKSDEEVISDEPVEAVEKVKSDSGHGDGIELEEPAVEAEAVEKGKSEDKYDKEDEDEDEVQKVKKADGADPVKKAKSFSVEELAESNKEALTLMSSLFSRVKEKAPDAEMWEVFDIIRDAMYSVDNILWEEKAAMEDQIWDQVWEEVSSKIQKAKSLKVTKAETPVDAMKALESLNPEMHKAIKDEIEKNKQKALEASNKAKEVERQKAYGIGADVYKRIGTQSNTTNQIVDALESIKVADPVAYESVSKALETASTIINGGNLFPDLGSAEEAINQTEQEYVDSKAKSLTDSAQARGESIEPAVARAEVRSTTEYKTLYSK